MTSLLPAIAVTVGEPAGIGPDLCLRLHTRPWTARLVLIGDIDFLRRRASVLNLDVRIVEEGTRGHSAMEPHVVEVAHVPLCASVVPGHPDTINAKPVLAMLDYAIEGCLRGSYPAIVTAPVHKGVINDAGISFMGHTEYLAAKTGTHRVVMMLVGGGLRVALATTHLPLRAVADALSTSLVVETLHIIAHDLMYKFGIDHPRVAVCGLNPHAGEGGHLGREEIDIISPAIATVCREGIQASGPFPADTIFVPEQAKDFDCILAMYHDQGLPPLKQASFGRGVNVTLGLPISRTSVDHGTALDLAATPQAAQRADPGSLFAAVELAISMVARRENAAA